MSMEVRVFGPPGTGKTTFLSRWIRQTAERHGSDSLLAMSFTRAAATEIVGRGLPIDRQRIGTLHSFAYRALGGGVIAEKKLLAEWNKTYPGLALTDENASVDDFAGPTTNRNEGDPLFAAVQRHRAQMTPPEPGLWEDRELGFYAKWQQFKQDTGSIDFTDMIDIALTQHLSPPLPFTYLFADECQDLTRLELALIRSWGEMCQATVLAGDDDQAIYWFKGALADAFLNPPLPDAQKRILGQSYRVPRKIVHYANAWIRDVQCREVKDYAPRDAEGEIHWKPGIQWARPTSILQDLEVDLAKTVIENGVERPYTVMILGTCAYMVDRFKVEFKRQGIPFANRFRRYRGDWNPLHPGRGIGIAQRLLAYLAPYRTQTLWSGEELKWWSAMLAADGVLIRGGKTKLAGLTGIKPVEEAELRQWFEGPALESGLRAALKCDTKWLVAHTTKQYAEPLGFPAKVLNRYGLDAIRPENEPPTLLGTIHSVKGGQADAVYIFPDLAPQAVRQWQDFTSDAHDALIRTFYVGFTRAREKLVLCGASSNAAVRFPMKLPDPISEEI
jgi:DNA helicase-2/ATP-dependent DNA helicase PcrA